MIAAALALAVVAQPADPPPPVWQGLWQGTINALPIRACLQRRGDSWAFGAYFYASRLRTIPLEQQNGSTTWLEGEGTSNGPPRPRWTFAEVGAARLTGSWSDGKRTLPFRLTRLPGGSSDPSCGDATFNAPRLRPLALRTARARLDGNAYTKLTFSPGPIWEGVSIDTFALDGADPVTRRINARLRKGTSGAPADTDWWGCMAGALDANGRDGEWQQTIEPVLITPRWVSTTDQTGSYCGGAHPNSDGTSITFDRRTGAEVDLHDWLGATAIARSDGNSLLRPAFRHFLIARDREIEAECKEAAGTEEFWDVGLTRTGLSFTPSMPHVLLPCANPILVPWRALEPWLSVQGRAGAGTLR